MRTCILKLLPSGSLHRPSSTGRPLPLPLYLQRRSSIKQYGTTAVQPVSSQAAMTALYLQQQGQQQQQYWWWWQQS